MFIYIWKLTLASNINYNDIEQASIPLVLHVNFHYLIIGLHILSSHFIFTFHLHIFFHFIFTFYFHILSSHFIFTHTSCTCCRYVGTCADSDRLSRPNKQKLAPVWMYYLLPSLHGCFSAGSLYGATKFINSFECMMVPTNCLPDIIV